MFGLAKNISTCEKNIVSYQRKNWFSDIRNPSQLQLFMGDSIPTAIRENSTFLSIITYIAELFENSIPLGKTSLPPESVKEVNQYEQEGKLCVYLSVLTYILLIEHAIATEKEMKFVQGYYHHKTEAINPIADLLGKEHVGSHAWITIGKSVIDISIKQEEMFYRFEEYPAILGKVPTGMTLKGFSEPKKTVNKYIEQMAKRRKLTVKEWLNYHLEQLESITEKQTPY